MTGNILIQVGKVKEIYEVPGSDMLEFKFTDNISVFDKIIPSKVPRKGETLCRTSAYWFSRSRELGVKTHFVELTSPNSMLVKRVRIERDINRITPDSRSILIPLEVIARYYVAGSLLDRLNAGKVRPESVGFPKKYVPKYGDELPEPLIEATTKLEDIDRPLSDRDAMDLAKMSKDEWEDMVESVLRIDRFMNDSVKDRGLIHVDGKKEFGFDPERQLMLLDTFGTADEDRFWDSEAYERGELVELSKELVRQHYRSSGYYDTLKAARDSGLPKKDEPPIPALPTEMIQLVSKLYMDLYERLTGERF
jgi:phosphoribosylaminoimidazole-succinocarboxamide synthase